VVVNRNAPAQIWRNATINAGGWIALKLVQPGANRDAVGAWIEVKCTDGVILRRELTVGGGHAGGQLGWTHFGLGKETNVELRVVWPDGAADGWRPVEVGKFYVAERGKPARVWE
jgi:enediyne biosynthesis protein E4